jgi:4-alpha-glucanotransferase
MKETILSEPFDKRRTGVLLHITSLPSADLGVDAYRFVDFLESAGVTVWQMLPLGPTHSDGSPYQCLSAHAGSGALVCAQTIKMQGWAQPTGLDGLQGMAFMAKAHQQFSQHATAEEQAAFRAYCHDEAAWLEEYVLFCEIRHLHHGAAWFQWPDELRDREVSALQSIKVARHAALNIRRFEQFQFYTQWHKLHCYAQSKGVLLFGDMPIFVAHDSADVWAEPELFTLDEAGQPTKVAGVPPDYFSETGQRWGNPLFEWQAHIDSNFKWWEARLRSHFKMFDLVRIDHFRGFDACWEIPVECETAIDGEWVKAPGEALFDRMLEVFDSLPVVAEDLGIITEDVTALRKKHGMPGMKILHFAFGDDETNPYLPHNHTVDSIAYTGTHDNDTTLGWYAELDQETKDKLHVYCRNCLEEMPWLLIRTAIESVSQMAVIPMQDILSLDGEHRMNVPGTCEGNWQWRFYWDMVDNECAETLRKLNETYGRIPE